ncbi:MAG: hypothetical protein WC289_04095, partial [Patescibacteria group bacterium]
MHRSIVVFVVILLAGILLQFTPTHAMSPMDDYIYPSSDLPIATQIRILNSRLTYCDYPTDFNRIVVRIKHLGGTITGNIDTLYQKCVERR